MAPRLGGESDSQTEAFLDFLIAQVPHSRLLLLVNYRPEYRHDWGIRQAPHQRLPGQERR
ncbi:hypothetical protein CBM2589_U10175 [Cupriavidus taiwanensis]|uniref:Uncharacterized protein n=1 Tax=Cupriavidus taiwanensis TaxID=164546 RepID=A0A375CQW0_9BURK|nr:hypothetical protein [Cupriavidus taiwanensis]SOY77673.1 hypothetical protein CBM2589_U10175 [Cupriavidus taiwanensis]